MKNRRNVRVVSAIAATMLILAPLNWLYVYYEILRVAVCSAAVFLVWYFYQKDNELLTWLFIAVAVLFNPIAPIHFSWDAYVTIDMLAALAFVGAFVGDSNVKILNYSPVKPFDPKYKSKRSDFNGRDAAGMLVMAILFGGLVIAGIILFISDLVGS